MIVNHKQQDNLFGEQRQAVVEVDTAAFRVRPDGLHVLLVKRLDAPYAHTWALPGVRLLLGERLADAARRALFDRTGLDVAYLEQLYAFDDPSSDRPRDPRGPTISVTYIALLPLSAATDTRLGRGVEETRWWPVQSLPYLAFDHRAILDVALDRVATKADGTPIAFSVLDAEFTMSELRLVHEALTGQPATTSENNFWRLMVSRWNLEATGTRQGGRGRPAFLYRLPAAADWHPRLGGEPHFLAPTQAGAKNFDGQLPLDDVLAKCRSTVTPIWIGFTGGKDELMKRPPAYLRNRHWKWRSSLERAVKANWIPGDEFFQLMEQVLSGRSPSAGDTQKLRWDYGLDLSEVVERCARSSHETFVGFYSGLAAFEHAGLRDLQSRRGWKWHDPKRHVFVDTGKTWIPATQFVKRVNELTSSGRDHGNLRRPPEVLT